MKHREIGIRTVFVGERAMSRRLQKARLVVIEGADEGEEFEMKQSRIYAGRASINDLQLRDTSISGTHFEIEASERGFLLRDRDSTNGTFLGGCRVKEVYLSAGATFRAGNTTIRFEPVDDVVEIPLSDDEQFEGVIGRSVSMREVFATLEKVAPSELTCLILGETGTGKECVARAIHQASRRKHKPFVVLDCSAIPAELVESYVFGHEKGAFTGAHARREGIFEQAAGGTVFLDEIGELDLGLQPKLLRVLENREFKRVGGSRTLRSDCRVVAATNRDLREMVHEGDFREDLFFRLSVIQVMLPPLVARRDDIPLLVEHFLDGLAKRRPDRHRARLSAEALDALMRHEWPGNVRELRNVLERAVSLSSGAAIGKTELHLKGAPGAPSRALSSGAGVVDGTESSVFEIDLTREYKDAKQELLDQFEREYVARLYAACDENLSRSAREAGLTRYYLRELLKRHGLK